MRFDLQYDVSGLQRRLRGYRHPGRGPGRRPGKGKPDAPSPRPRGPRRPRAPPGNPRAPSTSAVSPIGQHPEINPASKSRGSRVSWCSRCRSSAGRSAACAWSRASVPTAIRSPPSLRLARFKPAIGTNGKAVDHEPRYGLIHPPRLSPFPRPPRARHLRVASPSHRRFRRLPCSRRYRACRWASTCVERRRRVRQQRQHRSSSVASSTVAAEDARPLPEGLVQPVLLNEATLTIPTHC